jgi:uncharacterized membrane protein YeiH
MSRSEPFHRGRFAIPRPAILRLDIMGLAPLALAGAEKARIYKRHPYIAILCATTQGAGGQTVPGLL